MNIGISSTPVFQQSVLITVNPLTGLRRLEVQKGDTRSYRYLHPLRIGFVFIAGGGGRW